MGIFIAILFILLLICFYFLVLLNMKINRFKETERKQELLIEEMEAAITSFLTDIEDENKKLVQSLREINQQSNQKEQVEESMGILKTNDALSTDSIIREQELIKEIRTSASNGASKKEATKKVEETFDTPTFNTPRVYAKNAYGSQKQPTITKEQEPVEKKQAVQTIEQRVKDMYVRGIPIEEIAKQLHKGKTEIELLLKFQNKRF